MRIIAKCAASASAVRKL